MALRSCFLLNLNSLNSVRRFQSRGKKCLIQSDASFPIGNPPPPTTDLVEDVEILLPVKFRWIPLSHFRGEVENVSANQRPGQPSCFFPIGSKNTNLVEGVEILLSVKFRWNLFSGFRGEVENVKVYAWRTTDGRTDDGRCAMAIAHSSLRLRWAKNLK